MLPLTAAAFGMEVGLGFMTLEELEIRRMPFVCFKLASLEIGLLFILYILILS